MQSKIRTRRDENKIILWFIILIISTIILLIALFFSLIPRINEIEDKKAEVISKYNELTRIEKEWLTLDNLKTSIETYSSELKIDKSYIDSMLKDLSNDFYDKNIKNTTDSSYQSFITKKIDNYKNDKSIDEKIDIVSNILPYYSSNVESQKSLSDFEFINYIESIVETFNLTYSDTIWINEVIQLEDYLLTNSDNSLDKWIFKIPVNLTLSWKKSSIIDFLYYIENVWKISIDNENNNIVINKETSSVWNIFSEFKRKKLEWKVYDKNQEYNIFNNQIIDIENIYMDDYIDSSEQWLNNKDDTKEFLKYLKSTQDNEKFIIKVRLNFYVKWLPKYKIDEFVTSFDEKLKSLDREVNILLWKNNDWNKKQKLMILKQNIENIKNSLVQNPEEKKEISVVYENISSYRKLLDEYEEEIKKLKI